MDQEGVMLREINQRTTNTVWFCLYMKSKKQSKWTNNAKQKQFHRPREKLMISRGEGAGEKGRKGKGE